MSYAILCCVSLENPNSVDGIVGTIEITDFVTSKAYLGLCGTAGEPVVFELKFHQDTPQLSSSKRS